MRTAHIIGGFAVLLLGVATVAVSWLTLPYIGEFGPGPGFLPFWMGVVLTVCAVPVIVAALRAPATPERLFRPETARCLQVLGMIVAVFLVLPILGFSVGLALITGGGMRLMGKHGWLACGATVLGAAVGIHLLFGQWLGIPLPTGVIGW
jgi:hypothetical protein